MSRAFEFIEGVKISQPKISSSLYFFPTLIPSETVSLLSAVNCVSLAQLLSLCGFVAFWQVSHLERSVSTELRRRRGEKEEKEEKEKGPVRKNKVYIMMGRIVYTGMMIIKPISDPDF